MHVAILSAPPNNHDGWGRYTHDLVSALAERDIRLTLITSTDAPPTTTLPVAEYHRVLPSVAPAPRFSSLRLLSTRGAIRRLTRTCDLLHVTAEPYAITAPANKPLVVTAHGTFVPLTVERSRVKDIYRGAYERAWMICVSSYTETQVKHTLPAAHTVVILNGVHASRYRRPVPLPSKWGRTLLTVGALKPRKGYHIIVSAMKHIRAAIPDAQAVFIGDDSDAAFRQQLLDSLAADGLQDAVHILGHVSEDVLVGWYQASDVFALPSVNIGRKFEGFGLVYLEANAAGLPVIGTLDCGAEDAIRQGETGYLVPQNDPDAFADAAIRLLGDEAHRRDLGKNGRTHAERHTWARVASRVHDVYRTALHSLPSAPR
jgi:glycosyltransferase involved in cell wall biosynthesis